MPVKRAAALTFKGNQGSGVGGSLAERNGPTPAAAAPGVAGCAAPLYRVPGANDETHPGIPTHVAAFSRGGAISRLLTPPTSRAQSIGSRVGCDSQRSRSDSSSLFHSCYSSSARSSAEPTGTASATLISAYGRSYRHNPYIASPATAGSPLMPESPASVSLAEQESARDLSFGGGRGAGEQGRRCIIRSRHARSSSRSTSGCSRALAGPIIGMGYHPSALLQPQQLAAIFPPQHSVEPLSREGSFLGRSDPSSVGQSCRSSPAAAAAPLAMLLASASSFRGTQHGAHHHHPLTYHQSSSIYGAGGATPETSALYQSLGSINVTGSTNSNNPYIGVRMTPETTQLQPQSVAHGRSSEADPRTAVLETNTHSLSAHDTQPLELPLLRESNQYETGFREAQQRWMTAALPTQVVPLYANGSRHSNPQSSPLTAALGESNRNSSSTARTASADYAIVTNRLQELMPPAITPNESTGLEPRSTVHQREQQQQQQQQRPFSLPSHSGTPHEGCVRSYSPRSAAQQQRATPQQPALYISPSHAVAMSTMGSTTVSRGTSMGDTSRSHSVARGATGQLSPLSTIASTVSPVPLAEVELVPDIYNSSSLTDSIAEDEVHRQQETSRTRSPHRPCTAVGRARPRYAAHSPLSTPPPYHDVCADALNSTQTELLSDTEPRLTPASAGTSAGLLSPRQQSNHHAASACSAEDEKVHDYSDVRRPFQHSYGGASPAQEMAAHMLEEAEAPKNRQSPSAQLVPAGATNPDNDAAHAPKERDTPLHRSVDRAQVENDVEDSDKEGKGDDDDGDEGSVATADPAQTSKGKKKRRVRRNRKAKVLEDLPPVTSMKYLPPPPPPVTSVLLDLAGAASVNASSPSAFDKYYAVLLRWYTRLLADEADVVDTANACSFDATTAAAAMGAEACQIRGGSYAAAGKPPSGWLLQSLHSGPISPPMGPISPTLMSNPAPAYFGGSGGNAEVHVRCPRIEQYMALCDIPAELRLALNPNTAVKLPGGNKAEATAETQVIGSATVVLPQSVKDVPSAVRWAHDLETWWFCYVFPHVAHTRHQPPATWPPPQQQQQPASMSPVGLTISHPGAGTVGYDYSYGWPTAMSQPMINPIPVAYGAHGSRVIDGTHPMIGNGISSSVYEHIPMQPQLPAPLPPMPPGYLMSVYSAY